MTFLVFSIGQCRCLRLPPACTNFEKCFLISSCCHLVPGTDQGDRLFLPRYILGKRRYEQLLESFEHLLSGEKATQRRSKKPRGQKSTLSGAEDEVEKSAETEEDLELTGSELATSVAELGDKWPAMDKLRCQHLLCIAQMMRAISPRPTSSSTVEITDNMTTPEYLEQDPISPREFVALMQVRPLTHK